jgi:hypothetical protein
MRVRRCRLCGLCDLSGGFGCHSRWQCRVEQVPEPAQGQAGAELAGRNHHGTGSVARRRGLGDEATRGMHPISFARKYRRARLVARHGLDLEWNRDGSLVESRAACDARSLTWPCGARQGFRHGQAK